MKLLILLITFTFLLLSCNQSSDPSPKGIPFEPAKKADKKLNDVSFNPSVDILFVIDDSGSMRDFQNKLAQNAEIFIERFFQVKFIDYHIAVTTSSINSSGSVAQNGNLHEVDGFKWVKRDTVDGDRILADMMRVGTRGSASEKFFPPFVEALDSEMIKGANKGFYRQDAKLALFTLTDADDQSLYTSADAFDFLLKLKKGQKRQLHYIGTVIEQAKAGCSKSGEPRPTKIKELIDLHKDRGFQFDLCESDYGSDLARVAAELVRAVSTVYLDQLPDVRTIKVTYGKHIIPNDLEKGWTYDPDTNSIFLSPNIDIREEEPQDLKVTFEAIYK